MPAACRRCSTMLADKLDLNVRTVTGKTLGENIAGAEVYNADVIRLARQSGVERSRHGSAHRQPGAGWLRDEAVGRRPAPAEAFRSGAGLPRLQRDVGATIDSDDLEVTADHVIVLQNAGPVGGPGMPEWGMLPIPKKLLKQGVRDMLRISDARMSGTSYGACILHVAPESYIGGPLAAVRTGDIISVDVERRSINLEVTVAEIERRLKEWSPPNRTFQRGYNKLYAEHITQADKGCDFDFLEGTAPTPEPEIH